MAHIISHADNLTLRAWRRGELAPDDADTFETRLFFEPALAEASAIDLELSDALADFRTQEGAQVAAFAPLKSAPDASRTAPPSRHRKRSSPWSMLLAAGVGALAVLPFTKMVGEPSLALGNVELVSLDVRRSSDDREQLVAPRAGTQAMVIEMSAPVAASGPYSINLIDASSEKRTLSVQGLTEVDGLLSLTFQRDALTAGDYRVEIADASGEPMNDPLKFHYQPQPAD